MPGARRRDRFGPPSILLGTAALLTALLPAASSAAATSGVAQCPAPAIDLVRSAVGRSPDRPVNTRVEQRLSSRGELTGSVLRVDHPGMANLQIALPPESFVGRPAGDALVYTRVVGGRSEARVIDVVSGCDTLAATPPEIVRSAILDPSGSAVYVHSVTRAGRRDAGVARHDLATGGSTPVVPALPPTLALGPVFGTELRWSVDEAALAVQSCGFAQCLTRIVEAATGIVTTYDVPGQGALIGVTQTHLVTYAACHGLPCPVISHDRSTGAIVTLATEAFGATLTGRSDGTAVLNIETATGSVEVEQ